MTNEVHNGQRELWLYLHFPLLELESLTTADADRALAVVTAEGNPHRILCGNQSAVSTGVEPGLSLSTALALCPGLQVLQRQPAEERETLNRMALLAYRFSPTIVLAEPDGLWLELAGSRRLFNGYGVLLKSLQEALASQAVTTHAGIGHSPAAARLLCNAEFPATVPTVRQLRQRLAATALDTLELSERQRRHLAQLGLHTLGELLALPRQALGQRLGRGLIQQLEQLLGESPCTLTRFQPPPHFQDALQSPDGIRNKQGLLFPMKALLQGLCHYLIARQCHCRAIHWRFEPLLGEPCGMTVQLSGSQNQWSSLLTLSRLQLERLELPGSIERVVLHSDQFVGAPANCLDLFGDHQREAAIDLVDQLTARLGPQALWQPVASAQSLPERAGTLQTPGRYPEEGTETAAPQPLWLLSTPVPIRRRGQQLIWREPLSVLRGPERRLGNWWREVQQRDYYVAANPDGACYWVFRERHSKRWFVHGVFA